MKLLLSGEGPTDIGKMVWTGDGWRFRPGPMGVVVDRLCEAHLGYSIFRLAERGAPVLRFVSRGEISELRQQRSLRFNGAKYPGRTAYFFVSAMVLGQMAADELNAGPVVAVLFRDFDGTQTTRMQEWELTHQAMLDGFRAGEFDMGVPMLPRPKSEAWLLCALRDNRHQDCSALEDESGNDASPNSLKKMLADCVGRELNSEELADLVQNGSVDPERIDMPSYNAFRERLREVVVSQMGQP